MDTSVVILSGWKEDIEELNSVLIFLKKTLPMIGGQILTSNIHLLILIDKC